MYTPSSPPLPIGSSNVNQQAEASNSEAIGQHYSVDVRPIRLNHTVDIANQHRRYPPTQINHQIGYLNQPGTPPLLVFNQINKVLVTSINLLFNQMNQVVTSIIPVFKQISKAVTSANPVFNRISKVVTLTILVHSLNPTSKVVISSNPVFHQINKEVTSTTR
uniref:Uncharacterized protein n=1 Tax=Homalodisca liturata TaxID=320908 RepID=A0A1B6IF50_9HEMI